MKASLAEMLGKLGIKVPEGTKSLGIVLPEGIEAPKKARKSRPLPPHALLDPSDAKVKSWEVLIIGFQPTRLNVLMATRWRSSLKRKDAVIIGNALRRHGVPKATKPRRLTLVIILGPRQRGGDPDAYDKSARDALVRCGALVDDNRQWLLPQPTQYERGPLRSCRIILEET